MEIMVVKYVKSDSDDLALFDGNFAGWDYCDDNESDLLLVRMDRDEVKNFNDAINDLAYSIQGYGKSIEDADGITSFVIDKKHLNNFRKE